MADSMAALSQLGAPPSSVAFRGVPPRPFVCSVVSYSHIFPNCVLGEGRWAPKILGASGGTRQNMADSWAAYPNLGAP